MYSVRPLVPLTDADLEINFDRLSKKRKLTLAPSSSIKDSCENNRPLDYYLTKKNTNPRKFCPAKKPATQQVSYQPVPTTKRPISKEEDDAKLKAFLDARPHFRVERLPDAKESEDMKVLRQFRRRDFLAAQAAKASGGFKEEPPKKKRARVP